MKTSTLFSMLTMCVIPMTSFGATCSKANITRCLDSACAINVSSNPAARCQYCGTSTAGTPPTNTGMRSVSVGQSSKNTLSDKELKKAPTDPGERYAWATAQCIAKVGGCTADDVSEIYDSLIEQSCTAAGISAQMASLRTAAAKAKTKTECDTDINACVINTKNCGPNYTSCQEDADFDKFFAACSIEIGGCDDYLAELRTTYITARNNAFENAGTALANLVQTYQDARAKRLTAARDNCTDNAGRDSCIAAVCERSMPNKCGVGFESERASATQLCKFYDVACAALNRVGN